MDAWNKIKDGTITLKKLKKTNKYLYYETLLPRIDVLFNTLEIFSKAKVIKKFIKSPGKKGFNCDFVFYNEKDNSYNIITSFIDKSTKSYCSGASFLKKYRGDFSVTKYIKVENPEINISNYSISLNAEYNNIDFKKLDNL